MTIVKIPALVKQAQIEALTPINISAGVQATSTYPFNRDILHAASTDREQVDTEDNDNKSIHSERQQEGLADVWDVGI